MCQGWESERWVVKQRERSCNRGNVHSARARCRHHDATTRAAARPSHARDALQDIARRYFRYRRYFSRSRVTVHATYTQREYSRVM